MAKRKATTRTKYQCIRCGVRIQGRANALGEVKAYDRAPSSPDAPAYPCLCWSCVESGKIRVTKIPIR